jgi:predicted kinase
MDLHAHGRPDLATVFLNAYLEAGGDYAGLPVLRFYMVGRALVRGMVAALREGQSGVRPATPGSRRYLTLAQRLSHQWDPRLLITHGLPGSGKTFVSGQLLEHTGAIRVRSDVERARLLGSDRYDAADTAQVYGRLGAVARMSLSSGYPTIVDAACLKRAERDALRAVAEALAAPFAILDCTAPIEVLRQRVRDRQRRGDDASQADETVLELLLVHQEALDADERQRMIHVDTQTPLSVGAIAAAWLRATPPAHG